MFVTLYLLGCLTGIAIGFPVAWYLSRKNTVILTEQSINEGLAISKNAAKKRMDKYQSEFKKQMDGLLASTRTQLEDKLGLDNGDRTPHTNEEADDTVNISREARSL